MEPSAHRAETEPESLTPRQIFERLDRFVIGQDDAKRAVAIAAYNHLKRIEARRLRRQSLLRKSNILLIGPTGCGKTHIARNLAEILSVPFTVADATEYTEAGYYGKDVETMVSDLVLKASTIEGAQRGIIFIDEVDKIARRTQSARNGAGARDIGGEGVQQALLKLLEGREVQVPVGSGQSWNKHDSVIVDTRDILFICAGTFSDLFDFTDESRHALGFGAKDRVRAGKRISLEKLVDFGMLAEFLGRLPVMVQLQALGQDELMRVLTDVPDSITRELHELLALDEIDVEFTEGALRAVVRQSFERRLGARGLRSLMEQVMAEAMFEAPETRRRKLLVDERYVQRRLATARV